MPKHSLNGWYGKSCSWSDIAIVQVVKQRAAGSLTIHRRIVQGNADLVERLIQASQGQGGINTAYIERLNATFRQSLAALAKSWLALVFTSVLIQVL